MGPGRLTDAVASALARARVLAEAGDDDDAKRAYLDVLALDANHFDALNELGTLAFESGHRAAARTAYGQAVARHPDNAVGRVNLGNLLLEEGDPVAALTQFRAAVRADPDLPPAHQGLARALTETGGNPAPHWQKGFLGHAVVARPRRGPGPFVPLLLMVDARGGNMHTRQWIDEHRYAVTALYPEFYPPDQALPPHALVVNAIGDPDRAALALAAAERLLARTTAPVINPAARIWPTARVQNAARLGRVAGVTAPRTRRLRRDALSDDDCTFPVLLRAPGFHTGQHFVFVADRDALADAAASLPGAELLAIDYLDARGADGMSRKYRVMFVDGALYPLHLAISRDWKVHYFTADMAAEPAHRDEERRFLTDMASALGPRAMRALHDIVAALALDYAGIDFGLAGDGSLLLFEANATMVVVPPGDDPIWDYRRPASAAVLAAARAMLARRAP